MKLYTFVVHYLQMCMKEYGCWPKFKRGDNSTYTFTKKGQYYDVQTLEYRYISKLPMKNDSNVFLHAHLQVVYHNCVKFHKNSISSLVGVALTTKRGACTL
jgi:hypothetical protein